MKMKLLIWASIILLAFLALTSAGFYTYWQTASPAKTCASCHEIEGAHDVWTESPHREIECADCHGTALSAGWHSMKEKAQMVFTHFSRPQYEDIRLNEQQVVEAMAKCSECHAQEHADWLSGGHSATYADIFLNEKHNQKEQLSESCLRCHGMFFSGRIADVVTPLNITGLWKLVDPALASLPVIPCLACHEVHVKGSQIQQTLPPSGRRGPLKSDSMIATRRCTLPRQSCRWWRLPTTGVRCRLPKTNTSVCVFNVTRRMPFTRREAVTTARRAGYTRA
jgi:hypothetical protein